MAYTIGVIAGIIVTIVAVEVIVVVICKFGNKDGKVKTEYDERQKLEILKGYRIAFWTLCALLVLVQIYKTIADTFGKDLLAATDFGIIAFTLIIISITVFCIHSIKAGAYWGMNNNKTRFIIVIAVIGLINLVPAIGSIIRGDMIVNGAISGSFVNIMCGIMMIIIIAAVVIKDALDKKDGKGE